MSKKTLSSCEQEHNRTRQAAVGVLSLRRAPKLGKIARVLRLDLLFVRSPPPAEPKGARSAGPIVVRGSVSPDIYGAPGRGRRDCVNLIRRSHELDLHSLHQHATEEEDFGGSRSIHVTSATVGANEWWDGRRRNKGRQRGSP